VGKTVRNFRAPKIEGERPHAGSTIETVEAVGKHLLIHFDDGLTLQTHMMMSGSWHLYRPGERWQRPAHMARVVIEVDDWVAVCFLAPVVRSYRAAAPRTPIDHLGVDLCRADVDVDVAVQRIARFAAPDSEIAAVLLDQRIACGVGNVWKSESLFVERIDPFRSVASLTDDERVALLATAARQLRAQITSPTSARAVYGRRGQPCRRCGTPIAWRPQGPHRRGTYWCPACQR